MDIGINNTMQEALKGFRENLDAAETGQDFKTYRNNAYNVVSIFGYHIGIPKEQFDSVDNPAMMESIYRSAQRQLECTV